MELVYLWVEEYKNIKRQGFNFSPRFRCEYDEEKNELEIKENKEYINIFPKNISITGIVGENGAGKSSIGGEFLSKKLILSYPEKRKCLFIIVKENKLFVYNDTNIIINSKCDLSEEFFFDHSEEINRLFDRGISLNDIENRNPLIQSEFEFLDKKSSPNKSVYSQLNILGFRKKRPDLYNIGRYVFSIISEVSSRDNQFTANSYRVIRPLERRDINEYDKIMGKLDGLQEVINLLGFPFTVEKNEKKVNFVTKDNKNISFGNLSFGEKFSIHVLASIYHRLKHNKESIFFLDEVTLSMNPRLERRFINILLSIVEKVKNELNEEIKVHFIITSHSPFILSDIPRNNVIFLSKNEKNSFCQNDSKNVNINSFGANIHTLLSNGFFMNEGLMGEFAKNEISKILTFLNNEEKLDINSKNDLKYKIEIIGEDFLRNKLLDLYYKKFEDDEENRKKYFLEKKICDLQKQLDELNK